MERTNLQEELEMNREAAVERHMWLHNLFVEDRLGFERERKRMIDEFLNGIDDPDKRDRMIALQKSWDNKMRNAGSAHNRFVLARTFFWSHFHETWQPAIREFSAVLNGETKASS